MRFLKLLPIATLLAAGAPQAWATNCDSSSGWICIGTGGGSRNTNVVVSTPLGLMSAAGGYSDAAGSINPTDNGEARYNILTIENGGEANEAAGGWGAGSPSVAEENEVIVREGGLVRNALGGRAFGGSAIKNKVFIDGGKVTGGVFGGEAHNGGAKDNRVTLAGATVDGEVWGGKCEPAPCDATTGNTLAVQGAPSTVKALVTSFDTLEFTLSASTQKGVPMLKVGDAPGTGDAIFPVASSTTAPVTVTIKLDGATLAVGDTFTLIEAANKLEITPAPDAATAEYFKVTPQGNQLIAEVIKVPPLALTLGPTPYYYSGDSSSPTMGELGLLFSGIALAGVAAPALRRRERKERKQD